MLYHFFFWHSSFTVAVPGNRKRTLIFVDWRNQPDLERLNVSVWRTCFFTESVQTVFSFIIWPCCKGTDALRQRYFDIITWHVLSSLIGCVLKQVSPGWGFLQQFWMETCVNCGVLCVTLRASNELQAQRLGSDGVTAEKPLLKHRRRTSSRAVYDIKWIIDNEHSGLCKTRD